jgi:hypothetical protein
MSKSVGRSKASKKTRKAGKDLEEEQEELDLELDDEDLDLDEDLEDLDLSDDDLDDEHLEGRKKKEPSISKEINKMINETIRDIKGGDLAVPAIGLGLVAIIGFAMYKGAKL